MAIEAKITLRDLEENPPGNNITAGIIEKNFDANITTRKVDANITTRSVEAKVSSNKVEAKVVTHTVVVSIPGRQGASAKVTWISYAGDAKHTGVETIIASGKVLEYILDGDTIYRFINATFVGLYPSEDSFYDDFDGTNLTNLLATRG